LNRYPALKQAFVDLAKGKFENIEVEYIPGMPPGAYFYDENGAELEQVTLQDMPLDNLRQLLADHGFVLRKPTLAAPKLASEFALGGVHYQFFGAGQRYYNEARQFAEQQSHEGQHGRLLTLQCKEQEEQIAAWINKYNAEQGETKETKVWLGLTDQVQEGQFIWTAAGVDVSYSHWNAGEPNNAGGDEDCVTWSPANAWNDVMCEDDPAQLIVEFGPIRSGACPEPVLSDINTAANHDVHGDL